MHWLFNSNTQAIIFTLLQLTTIQSVKADPKDCDSAGISFTVFEPKKFSWWTGTIQNSALLINGKKTATLRLAYDNKAQYVDNRTPDKYTTVLGQTIGIKDLISSRSNNTALFSFKNGSPSGFAIPMRYDGKTALSTLYLFGKSYANVSVDFEYDHPMQFESMMLDIVCFLKSDFVKDQLK